MTSRFPRIVLLAALATLFVANTASRAQSKPINPNIPPPPPPSDTNSSSNNSSSSTSAPPAPVAKRDPTVPPPPPVEVTEDPEPDKPDLPAYDPVAAERSIEVGQFYMKQGNLDAAIERFNDAVKQHPGYGKPFELLGAAYEKKRDYANAIKSYQQCLRVYPHDPDRKKIEAHIAELQKKQEEKEGK